MVTKQKKRTSSDWLMNTFWTNQSGQRKREQEANAGSF